MISLLSAANTASEILEILDSLVEDNADNENVIEFWYVTTE